MSEKGLFSLKTLYTITDCYSKYQSVQEFDIGLTRFKIKSRL